MKSKTVNLMCFTIHRTQRQVSDRDLYQIRLLKAAYLIHGGSRDVPALVSFNVGMLKSCLPCQSSKGYSMQICQ